ncbi:EAL domain-containing protein [Paraburkholderia sp. RL18-103-BIB-C]|uniref:EAL domain-containing protein n=1 Tax=Paraburkholderia sp. RL18-103-BIB-C TaxID=3031637 RepID=UPI0038B9AB14
MSRALHSDVQIAGDAGAHHASGSKTLASAFQPVYGLAQQKPVGYEALLREVCPDGRLQLPAAFAPDAGEADMVRADAQSHAVHLTNAGKTLPARHWLFLNIHASTMGRDGYAAYLASIALASGLSPEAIVLEVLEAAEHSLEELSERVKTYKDAGFLVALDDFGIGYSNVSRVLRLEPDIIKLDRSLIQKTARDGRLLINLIHVMHEAGMLIVAEGIETDEELLFAVRANVDFAQGYLLGRPASDLPQEASAAGIIDAAFDRLRAERLGAADGMRSDVEGYTAALHEAVRRMARGVSLADSCAKMLRKANCIGCFALDGNGRQVGPTEWGPAVRVAEQKFAPLSDFHGARWDNRGYFQEAISQPGTVVHTAPYLSVTGSQLCFTLTVALATTKTPLVLGVDVSCPPLHLTGVYE